MPTLERMVLHGCAAAFVSGGVVGALVFVLLLVFGPSAYLLAETASFTLGWPGWYVDFWIALYAAAAAALVGGLAGACAQYRSEARREASRLARGEAQPHPSERSASHPSRPQP
ncbi:MAG: hypothetical protein AB7N76_09145 [Planctomycetota bacterium]